MWANSLSIRTRFFFKVKTIPSMLLQQKITIQHPHTQYALLNSHSATQLAQTSCLFQIQPQNIHQVKILHALDKPTQQRFLQLSTSPWRRKSITVYGLHIETHTHTPSYTHSSSPHYTTYGDMIGNISYSFISMHKGHYCFLIISLYYF